MVDFPFRSRRMSDDDYIASVRKSLYIWDRYWLYLAIMSSCGLILLCVLVAMLPVALNRIAQPQPGGNGNGGIVLLGFLSGGALGTGLSMVVHSMLYILSSLLSGLRGQRLLIAYYDSLYPECAGPFQHASTGQDGLDLRPM